VTRILARPVADELLGGDGGNGKACLASALDFRPCLGKPLSWSRQERVADCCEPGPSIRADGERSPVHPASCGDLGSAETSRRTNPNLIRPRHGPPRGIMRAPGCHGLQFLQHRVEVPGPDELHYIVGQPIVFSPTPKTGTMFGVGASWPPRAPRAQSGALLFWSSRALSARTFSNVPTQGNRSSSLTYAHAARPISRMMDNRICCRARVWLIPATGFSPIC